MIKKTIYLVAKEELLKDGRTLFREASRAIITKDNLILMVYSNVNRDYKFPGGGIEIGETKKDALIREVLEEVGGKIIHIKSQFATITTINKESVEKDYDIFHMDSYYYICDIENTLGKQDLSASETMLSFTPRWVTLEEAIHANEIVLNSDKIPLWTFRETEVLKLLKNVKDWIWYYDKRSVSIFKII